MGGKYAPKLVRRDMLACMLLCVKPAFCRDRSPTTGITRPGPCGGSGGVLTQKAKLHESLKNPLSTWHREALGPRFSLSLWKLSEMSKLGADFRVAQKTCSHRYQPNLRNHQPPGFYYTALNIVNIFEISQVWGYTGLSVYFSSGH